MLEDSQFTYTYDANGNLTEKANKASGQRTVYVYDAENQLIRVEQLTVPGGTTPVMTAEYHYDALGRRIEKVVNGVSTQYVYDNEDIIVEFNAPSPTPALYIHGPGIDEPLAMFRSGSGGGLFTFHADGLGSITTLTDAFGDPVRTYTYDSFGRIVAQTGTLTNPYTYTGREFDPETGLFYYRARYYDPTTGRFIQKDPVVGFRLIPGAYNRYVYVLNNPITEVDPSGRSPVLVGLAIGAAVGGISAAINGQNIAAGILFGALAGAVSGIVAAPVGIVGVGALAGFTANIGNQASNNFAKDKPLFDDIDYRSAVLSAGAGAIGGAAALIAMGAIPELVVGAEISAAQGAAIAGLTTGVVQLGIDISGVFAADTLLLENPAESCAGSAESFPRGLSLF